MGGQAPLQLPKIDFSSENLTPGSDSWRAIGTQVLDALLTFGCFEADFPQIPKEARAAVFPAQRELFALPTDTKSGNNSSKPYHGYIGHRAGAPLYESFGIDSADIEDNVESFTRVMWPEGNPNFRETILAFARGGKEVDRLVRRLALECLGVEKYCDSYLNNPSYLLRVMKYDAPRTEDPKVALPIHADATVLSIIYAHDGGLELQTKDGEWVRAVASPDSFVVLAGDAFQIWTNGQVHSPLHRVMMAGDKERYSVGVFVIPYGMVQVPPEFIDEEHPLLYKPFDYQEFLKYSYTEEGLRSKSAMKAYCGISY